MPGSPRPTLSLQNVLQKLTQATYVMSSDTLVSILNDAIAAKGTTEGVGLTLGQVMEGVDDDGNAVAEQSR